MHARRALLCTTALALGGCNCFVPVLEGGDAGADAGERAACDGGTVRVRATEWVLVDEEFPNWARTERLHLRDDAKACGGVGAVRTLVRWDLSALRGLQLAGPGAAQFRYAYGWDGYAGPARVVALARVRGSWDASTPWAALPATELSYLGTSTLQPVIGATLEFPIQAQVLREWVDGAGPNDGVLLRFLNEDCSRPRWPADFDPPELRLDCL
jgi:hypothetical protein